MSDAEAIGGAVLSGLLSTLLLAVGVAALAALESLWLLPSRGVLSTFARARAQFSVRSEGVDVVVGAAGMAVALLGPAVAAALLAAAPTGSASLSAAALLLIVPAPVFLALGAGHDEHARLALHDALATSARRALVLLAVVCVVDARFVGVVVVGAAAVVLVRGRHRDTGSLLPRFEDRLTGPALIAWRSADRAVVVVVAGLAGAGVYARLPSWPAAVVAAGAVCVVGVLGARLLGPQRGEGLAGPVFLLALAVVGRIVGSFL